MNDLLLATNSDGVLVLKLIKSVLFLEHILYQATAAVSHLSKSVLESLRELACTHTIILGGSHLVLQVPHIVSDELLHALDLSE